MTILGHVAKVSYSTSCATNPSKVTDEKLMAWLNVEPSNGNGQEEAPVASQPQGKTNVVQMPAPKAPPVQTKHGTRVADVLEHLLFVWAGNDVQQCTRNRATVGSGPEHCCE
jgi:hypothetical protein